MTNEQIKQMAKCAAVKQQYHQLLEKLIRMQQQLEEMERMGADKDWLHLRWLELQKQKQHAREQVISVRAQANRLQQIVEDAPDPLLSQILYLRYLRGRSWRQVAQRVGGMNSEDSVRKKARRYLQKIPFDPS